MAACGGCEDDCAAGSGTERLTERGDCRREPEQSSPHLIVLAITARLYRLGIIPV